MTRRMVLERTIFRESAPEDGEAIRAVSLRAHGREVEADLCDALIPALVATLSFVAETDGRIVAHALLTALGGPPSGLALEPVSVDPDWRDFLIGTELVRVALHAARERHWRSVFTTGDPGFYERFGFASTTADRAMTHLQGPRFMALELVPGSLAGWAGPLSYPAAFETLHGVPGR